MISRLAIFPIIGMLFHPLYMVVNAAYVGRMEPKYLAGLGLGSLTCGILLISIGSCFAMVMSSLVAPAFGAKKLRLCVVYLNRQIFLNIVIFAINLIPIFFIEYIFKALGQDPEVSKLASQFVWYVAPGVFF